METNDKKPKRPRISTPRPSVDSPAGYEKVDYSENNHSTTDEGYRQPARPYTNNRETYTPRPYNPNPQGGYQPRQYNGQSGDNHNGGYQPRAYNNRQGGYNPNRNQGNYQPRPYNGQAGHTDDNAQGGYQPRQYNHNHGNQRGYNNGPRQYNNNRQGGYNPNRNQGNYQPRPYNGQANHTDDNAQGGYQPRQYNNNRGNQRGFNNGPRQYNNNRQGGYNNGPRQYNNNNRRPGNLGAQMPRTGKSFVPRPRRIEYEMPIPDPDEQIRLNKFMANAGICSRREADEFIQQGLVKVNGETVTELGTKISHNDVVEYDEKVVTLENKCYILLNKPKDCVTTSDDPNGRMTVLDLVKGACNERIYPVGRLDRNTTGVLLLTNDGDLASKLTHPKYIKKKIYHVWTDKDISEEDMQRIADGIELEDGPVQVDGIAYANDKDRNQAGIEIHSGRNRIVRRIFESLGYHVTKLDRVYFAGLTKKNLPRGRWRYLTQQEVNYLKMGSFE